MAINEPKRVVSRRSVLEWLGKSYVMALGGSALAGCVTKLSSAAVVGALKIWIQDIQTVF